MNGLKASKRLIQAIVALIVSLVLCIGVCFAWFALNGKVDATGLNNAVRGINIKTLEVKVYRLDATDNENVYTKGDLIKSGKMDNYGGIISSPTVVLLEITYEFEQSLAKTYDIRALCSDAERKVEKEKNADSFNCNLSDAITFYSAVAGTGNSFTLAKSDSFYNGNVKSLDLKLTSVNCAASEANKPYTFYCAVDYVDTYITQLYALALENQGTLNSKMTFGADIVFYMSETTA